jgi:transposase
MHLSLFQYASIKPARVDPPETVRVACAALDEDNRYRKLGEHFDTVFSDDAFEDLTVCPGPVRQEAANAVRARIDWKYLLGLELTEPGFDFSILSRFRDRLIEGNAEMLLLRQILNMSQSLD